MKKLLSAVIVFSVVQAVSATTTDPTSTSTDLMATTTFATSSVSVDAPVTVPTISPAPTDISAAKKTFTLTVDDISEICGSSGEMPPAKYWWVFVNSLTETGGSCGGGSFCSQTFTTDDLSVNAEIFLPPRSDYYVVGTFCSDNTANPSNPNGNFWSSNEISPLAGDYASPFDPIFSVSD
ncbi:MAG TPA: hypothetical protein VJL36_01030 [Candidatus Paceibacterota bacterium]